MKYCLLIILTLFIAIQSFAQGFLRADGINIIDKDGNEIILRGIGLGGWMLQEGYMIKTSGFAGTQHQFEAKIDQLMGKEKRLEFYNKWYENHFTREDAAQMAEWGFNSIRLPMHYKLFTLPIEDESVSGQNTWLEKGFQMTDDLLDWCEENQMYLILDLHAAPGGQGYNADISDYDPSKPSLWESEANRAKTVALWKKLAERYANEEWIGGYDLINEPNWELPGNTLLREHYIDITNAIREVDNNHAIFIEGNWFATDFGGLTPPWDNNMVYSFHKYWNNNDVGTINYLLALRNNFDRPLWLGETGENSNTWFKDCVELMESNNIGWAWWPHKKIDNIVGPYSSPISTGYQQLLDYWNGSGSQPSADFAYNALMTQAENLKSVNCSFQPGVIDALIRQQNENTALPYKSHSVPGRIFASDYDIGARGIAYSDVDYQNVGGSSTVWNKGYSYRNDGVDIEGCTDTPTNGYNVGWIDSGEWLTYTFNCVQSGTYNINIRYAADNSNGKTLLSIDGVNLAGFIDMPSTGGWQNWKSVTIEGIQIEAGQHNLRAQFFFGGFNLNYFQFTQQLVGVEDTEEIINSYGLNQNYPNPFNSNTKISYTLPETSEVKIRIYDSTGQEIGTLLNELKHAGKYSIDWNTNNLASGIYYYKINTSSGFTETKKAIYLK